MDKATGRIVDGDPERLVEATELWTFRRDGGGPWKLSAIQQARKSSITREAAGENRPLFLRHSESVLESPNDIDARNPFWPFG